MRLTEFKAWFEGFTENISGVPSKKQWERIRERVGEIEPDVVDIPYVPYVPYVPMPNRPWWPEWYTYTTTYTTPTATTIDVSQAITWSSCANEVGRLEAGRIES